MATHRAASALILDADNSLLIVRRGETHPWAAHEPDLPGGFVEKDEGHPDGLVRELFEETGIVVAESSLREGAVFAHPDYFNNNNIEHSLYAFRFKVRPEVILSWEHDRYDWISLEEVRGLEKPVQREFDKLRSSGFFETL